MFHYHIKNGIVHTNDGDIHVMGLATMESFWNILYPPSTRNCDVAFSVFQLHMLVQGPHTF